MTMNMFFPSNDDPGDDNRIIDMAVEQSIWLAELGYHVWFTDHHFRGPWHSNPMQFAAYVAPLIPRDRYLGFGVLSIPFYHPVRLVESMNLLDQLTKGKVLFGVGSGWQGTEPTGLGIDPESHASGRLAEETLDVMERLWGFKYGDPEYSFSVGGNSGRIKRRVMPAPYSTPHPTIIRVATREAAIDPGGAEGLAGLCRRPRRRPARADAALSQRARRGRSSAGREGQLPALVLVRLDRRHGGRHRRGSAGPREGRRAPKRWRSAAASPSATAGSMGR